MIKTLKRRFIVLAMVSLTVLLAVIVAGINIVNYQKVVSDADSRLEVLQQNSDQLLQRPSGMYFDDDRDDDDMFMPGGPGFGDPDGEMEELFGRGGRGGPSMTQDEAEESRFFTVTLTKDGIVCESNVNRISSVDSDEAEEYAQKVFASGKEKGFVEDFRYDVEDTSEDLTTITFLDCGRVLESFKDFLKYSIMMSVLGLLLMFAVITYFAGRIVKPVAESYEKQKRFITDAGHEIKTPLAIIKANIDVMNMDIETGIEGSLEGKNTETSAVISEKSADELRDSLGDINDQVDRLTGLTNDLVYLSRMEEAGSSLVMTEVPLSELVSETADSFDPLAAEKGKEIEKEIEAAITVRGSSKELEKLLSIVLENAVKYSVEPRRIDCSGDVDGMPAPPVIHLTLKKDGRNAVIEVSNRTENELTNESLSHVFDRFYRTDSSRNSETGGHGIGLSMASAIVAAHGGKISARTTDGHDFMITASVPLG